MKKFLFPLLLVLAASCTPAPSARWIEGPVGENGRAAHTLVLNNVPAGSRVWFQELFDNHAVADGPEIVHYQGTSFYIDIPEHTGSELSIPYQGRPLPRRSWAPEGFVLQQKGRKDRPMPVEYSFLEHAAVRADSSWFQPVEVGALDLIPQLKMRPFEGAPESRPDGWYRITFSGGEPVVESAGNGALYARTTLAKVDAKEGVIEDWPDFPYRGFMLDVVRDFRTPAEVKQVLDILASYKVNTLHFHLADDESWCLEIEPLPELTAFGARHALPDWELRETEALKPTANGRIGTETYYTGEAFVDLLQYAWERGIAVVPEFDTPGHSRASIRAMEAYERRTGDDSFRLQDPADSSRYWTAQDFTDNVLSVYLPSVYKFYGVVFDEVLALYSRAGVPLKAIHIGGDEVPSGAWSGRDPAAMKEQFVSGMLDLAEARGIRLAGWLELSQHLTPATEERLKKNLYFLNLWSPATADLPGAYSVANAGFPVVLSNVSNAYLDLAYDNGAGEIGLEWGGFVDERTSFALQPWNLYASVRWNKAWEPQDVSRAAEGKTPLLHPENILGVEACLWSENLRSQENALYQMLPKALGIFERGWNAAPSWPTDAAFKADFRHFYSIISAKEMPEWDSKGYTYKKRRNCVSLQDKTNELCE